MLEHSPDINCGSCNICRQCPRLAIAPPPAESLPPTPSESEQYRKLVNEAVKTKIQSAIDGNYTAEQTAAYVFHIMLVYAHFRQQCA